MFPFSETCLFSAIPVKDCLRIHFTLLRTLQLIFQFPFQCMRFVYSS
uniref:Uncharacterized protein n=1 Tax=Arundo donax TaxID=35708 RepID=A0A0A9CL85_ARUDO